MEESKHFVGSDIDAALNRLQGNRELLRNLIDFFAEDHAELVDQLSQAASNGDAKLLVHSAHALKGAAGGIGGLVVAAKAAEIEQIGRQGRLGDGLGNQISDLRASISQLLDELSAFQS